MKKSNTVLLAVFLVLFAVAVIPYALGPVRNLFGRKTGAVPLFRGISAQTVTGMSIADAAGSVALEKSGSEWKVSSYSASPEKVNGVLEAFAAASESRIVSRNPENFDQLGVGTQSGKLLAVRTAAGETKFLVGNSGQENGSYYIRKADESVAYVADGSLKDALGTTVEDWRDKTVFNIPKDRIAKIDVSGGQPFVLSKTGDAWQITAGGQTKPVGTPAAESALGHLSPLTATGFGTTEEKRNADLSSAGFVIRIADKDGKDLGTFTARKQESIYLLTKPGDPELYKVDSFSIDDILQLPTKSE